MPRHLPIPYSAALVLAACASAPGPGAPAPAPAGAAAEVDRLADEYFAAWARSYPVNALFSGVPEAPDDALEDNSLAAARAWQQREDGCYRTDESEISK